MRKILAVLLAAALVFGFGATLVYAVVLEPSVVADGPGYPPLEPPPQWPPGSSNSIVTG